MMVRFSCFNSQIHSPKPKKTQSFAESMSILHNSSKVQSFQAPLSSKNSASVISEEEDMNGSCKEAAFDSTSLERDWKSEDMDGKLSSASNDSRVHQAGCLKKSRSEGGLHLKEETYADEDTEDDSQEVDQGNFLDGCNDVSLSHKNDERTAPWDTPQESLCVNNGPIFSIGDHDNSDRGEAVDISDARSSGENVDSGEHTPQTPVSIVRSSSLPNIRSVPLFPEEPMQFGSRPRSSDDLYVLNPKGSVASLHEMKMRLVQDWGRNHTGGTHNVIFDNTVEHCNDILNYHSPAREWIVPIEESGKSIDYRSLSSHCYWNELPGKDFKIKRIEDWVIDVEPCFPVEEVDEISQPDDKQKREVAALNTSITSMAAPSTEIAKRYISSLNPAAATAQLSNHGLTVVPFLSAFVSLKVLNLSGNAIVRITAGSLPRGLHMLNLSKNQITTIEGLRELTRLRVLDLSYNRILRIGHGLASCCSLKELYLAGNKISEVEGLHRLLKLNILDLRFNKISTAKCLGQLAANYNSLQAISLEGNPAQKNVGDEQLKKQLQGLLPKLTYYNRQLIKVGTSKDAADRSVRLGMGSHQSRSDYKSVRKGSHGTTSKVGSSTGRRSHHGLSSDKSKGKLAKLPPSGVGNKVSGQPRRQHHQQRLDLAPLGDRLNSLRKEISMRRSRSEGTLGAF